MSRNGERGVSELAHFILTLYCFSRDPGVIKNISKKSNFYKNTQFFFPWFHSYAYNSFVLKVNFDENSFPACTLTCRTKNPEKFLERE